MLRIERSRLDVPRWRWVVYNAVCVADSVFNLLACGFLTVRWRSDLLFSPFMDDDK